MSVCVYTHNVNVLVISLLGRNECRGYFFHLFMNGQTPTEAVLDSSAVVLCIGIGTQAPDCGPVFPQTVVLARLGRAIPLLPG